MNVTDRLNIDTIILNEYNTIPYDIKFASTVAKAGYQECKMMNDSSVADMETKKLISEYHAVLKSNNFHLSNYQSNFGHLQNDANKDNRKLAPLTVRNPLIVPLGISEYDKGTFQSLACVKMDYKNIQHAFNIVRGYDMVYSNCNNQIVWKRDKIGNINKNNNKKVDSSKQYKLRWTDSEIFEFNNKIHAILNEPKYNYDCLIYFISCHGDTGGIIYDSTGNQVPLISIYDKFSNQNCLRLRNKPKIYFVEACRGNMRTKRFKDSNFKSVNQSLLKLTQSGTTTAKTPQYADDQGSVEDKIDEKTQFEFKLDSTITNNNIGKHKYDDNKVSSFESTQDCAFSKYNYNREIYANTEGYAVIEPGSKGAYMTRSITQSIVNNDVFKKDFDQILIHSRKVMLKLMGISTECGSQVIDDHNNIPKKMFFQK